MFRIGEFSKLCGLSPDTLYHYEEMMLLVPSHVDKLTGYRYYEAEQLVMVNKILALKDAGFSLVEIGSILRSSLTTASLIEVLERKAAALEDELQKELGRLERLHTNIFLIKNGGIPLMSEITIKTTAPILAATIRRKFHKTAFDSELEAMWNNVNRYIESKGGKRTIPCMMLYHTGWWNLEVEAQLEVEVVEPIIKPFEGNGEVAVYELPAVEKMVCIVHNGSFYSIGEKFDALFKWIKQNEYTTAGPVREIYHKGAWATDNPEEYITELQIPVK